MVKNHLLDGLKVKKKFMRKKVEKKTYIYYHLNPNY